MAHPYDVADKRKFKAYQTERKGQNLQQHLKPIIGALTGQSMPSKSTLVSVGPVIFIVWERGSGGEDFWGNHSVFRWDREGILGCQQIMQRIIESYKKLTANDWGDLTIITEPYGRIR